MAEETTAEGGEEAPKKKIDMVMVLMGLQVLLVLGAAGVIGKIALFPKKHDLRDSTLKERAIASVRDDLTKVQILDLDRFTVMLPERHTLQARIQVEVSDQDVATRIQRRKPSVRARILNVLSSRSQTETSKLQGKLLLKDAIREAINEELSQTFPDETKGVVRDVYFMEFTLL